MTENKIIAELRSLNNIIRGFCEHFDCEDVSCGDCPIGPEICLALGKRNVELKFPTSKLERIIYWLRQGWW